MPLQVALGVAHMNVTLYMASVVIIHVMENL